MNGTRRARRWLLLGAVAAVSAVGVAHVAAGRRAAAEPVTPPPVDTPAAEVVAQTPSVSGDGQYWAWAGKPTAKDDPRSLTAFVQDRATGTVTELTPVIQDVRPGDTVHPVLSADGCNVVLVTQMALDLFRDDDEGDRWDVYTGRLPWCGGAPGDWQLVSTTGGDGFDSSAGDDASPLDPPAISGEGAYIAFTHRFSEAAPDLTAVTLVDLTIPLGEEGRMQPVASTPGTAPDSTFRYKGVRQPVISDDGTVVAVTSDADLSLLLGEWGSGPQPGGFATSHVYVWDRSNADRNVNVRRISLSPAGESGNADSPAISGDGRYVAFVSTASNLVPGATLPACTPECLPQVYVYDRTDGTTRLGSREPGDPAAAPVAANLGATQPALNRSGDELFYVSRSTNLFPTRNGEVGGQFDGDIVVTVPALGTVQRISTQADSVTPAPAVNAHPRVSANGRVVVFDTLAAAAFGGKAADGRQVAVVEKQPRLSLADLDMGSVAVGFPGPEWFLVLTNDGPSSFIPAITEVDNPDFIISGGTCVDQNTVPVRPGGACTVNLMLMPSKAGPTMATLTVKEFGFGGLTVSTTLVGAGGEPALAPTPAGARADDTVVGGRSEPMSFAVGNVAFSPVTMQQVTVEGRNPMDFQVVEDQCSGQKVDAGIQCTLQVLFAPTAGGHRTASIVMKTTDGAYTTMLVSGQAHYEPKLAASTTTVVAPSELVLIGAAFAPNTKVTLGWADGAGAPVTVTTDETGSLVATMIVRPNDRPGNRTVVAQTADGQLATADVAVVVPRGRNSASSPRFDG